MESNWIAKLMVERYLEKYLPLPTCRWSQFYLDQRLYARCAAREIIRRLDTLELGPYETIEKFISDLSAGIDADPADKVSDAFRIARGAAMDILDYI